MVEDALVCSKTRANRTKGRTSCPKIYIIYHHIMYLAMYLLGSSRSVSFTSGVHRSQITILTHTLIHLQIPNRICSEKMMVFFTLCSPFRLMAKGQCLTIFIPSSKSTMVFFCHIKPYFCHVFCHAKPSAAPHEFLAKAWGWSGRGSQRCLEPTWHGKRPVVLMGFNH